LYYKPHGRRWNGTSISTTKEDKSASGLGRHLGRQLQNVFKTSSMTSRIPFAQALKIPKG
jgi:hypothetical protein